MSISTLLENSLFAESEATVAEYGSILKVRQKKNQLKLTEKFAKIIETDERILQVDGFDPQIMSVEPLSPNQLRIVALKPGVSTMMIVDESNNIYSIDVFVIGDVRHLQAYIKQLFPGSTVEAVAVENSVVLRGLVAQPEHITEITDIAEEFYPKVLNQMKVGGVQQVMMRVKVMEVQRSKMRKFGFNFMKASTTSNTYMSTPGAIVDPALKFALMSGGGTFSGFLEALKEEGMLEIKAEPILVTTNGRPASLLNGGEFPILVPQSLGTVSIEWRAFGVNLEAVPIVLGNGRVRLELQPEVSEIDEANAVQIGDVRVPALKTRRVNTQVEMQFGQTLMIAGLISKRERAVSSKIPLFGEIPYLGMFFSTKEFEEIETELIVMVTPEFVSPLDASEVSPVELGDATEAPNDRELFFDGMLEIPNYGGPAFDFNLAPFDNFAVPSPDDNFIAPDAGGNNLPAPPPAPAVTPVVPEEARNNDAFRDSQQQVEPAAWWDQKSRTTPRTTEISNDLRSPGQQPTVAGSWMQADDDDEAPGKSSVRGFDSSPDGGSLKP